MKDMKNTGVALHLCEKDFNILKLMLANIFSNKIELDYEIQTCIIFDPKNDYYESNCKRRWFYGELSMFEEFAKIKDLRIENKMLILDIDFDDALDEYFDHFEERGLKFTRNNVSSIVLKNVVDEDDILDLELRKEIFNFDYKDKYLFFNLMNIYNIKGGFYNE